MLEGPRPLRPREPPEPRLATTSRQLKRNRGQILIASANSDHRPTYQLPRLMGLLKCAREGVGQDAAIRVRAWHLQGPTTTPASPVSLCAASIGPAGSACGSAYGVAKSTSNLQYTQLAIFHWHLYGTKHSHNMSHN